MNKKAFLTKTLFVLIVTIMIFSTSCSIGSKFFRLSSQAKDNFADFINEMEDLVKNAKEDGERRNNLLIIDKETIFAYFSKSQLVVSVDAAGALHDYKIYLDRPIDCDKEGARGCFCLFREVETVASFSEKRVDIKPIKVLCEPTEFEAHYNDSGPQGCGIGIPQKVNSYECEGGFFASREIVGKSDYVEAYYQNGRRINFLIEKQGDKIHIKEQ